MYGAEAVILNLARSLQGGPHRFALGAFSNSSNPNLQLHENALKEGFESHLIDCKGQMDPAAVARIRELVASTAADVVHAHGYKSDIYVYLALRGLGVPLVSTCHTWYDTDWIVSMYGRLDRFVLRKYSQVVAVSDEVKQRLLKAGVHAEKIRIVRNGIDLRPFAGALRPAEKQELIVGLVGRLAWEKGVDIFLRTAARVLGEAPETRFVVVGDGPDREKLEQLIDELKIRESVTILGQRDDMPSVYASLDVMVSSSRQEGLPMAILEGMACGLPLIATTVGEVPSVVIDGCTGILVPAENVELLATNILELLRDPARRAQLGTAARKLIEEQYSAARMTADYLCVYEEAIAACRDNSSANLDGSAK
ncbi:MAG: glycosyltransferase family 4 protein [Acidobacteriaceae bacterium]|nr:glycosyltransferase family 4 protein [Acidobacteriaceae bacterium]